MEDINSRAFNGKVKEGELVFKIRKNLCCCGRTNAERKKNFKACKDVHNLLHEI